MTTNVENVENVENYKNRIEIESLNIIGVYSLKAGKSTDNECHLCRQDLLAPSFEDLQNGNLKCDISLGSCGHAFHKTCIDRFYKNCMSCPIDKTPWNLSKVISNAD